MNETWSGIIIVALVVVYLPWIASGVISFRHPGGGGIWRFLSFLLCTFALVGIFFFIVPGVIAWIIAWMCAAASRSAMRSDERTLTAFRDNERMLQALQEQNKLLREHGGAKSAHITESAADYRGYTYIVAENGEAKLKLSSGAWRTFPSTQDLKAYVDAVLRGGGRKHVTWADAPVIVVLGVTIVGVLILIHGSRWLTEPAKTSAVFTMRSNTRASGSAHQPNWAYVDSVGECLENCARYTTCKAFTYGRVSGAVSGACYFYGSAARFVPDPNFEAGERN
jgi:PAN domain